MANRERGERGLVAWNRAFTLRLTLEACCEVEDRSGRSLEALIASVNAGSVTAVRWMVWASLQNYHATEFQSVDDVGGLMDAVGYRPMLRQMAEFLVANIDDDGGEQSSDAAEKKTPTWRERYVDARAFGIPMADFWRLSLLEFRREIAAARERLRLDWNRDITIAWHVAVLSNQKRLPALDKLLRKAGTKTEPQPQTWQEMKAYMKALAEVQAPGDKKDGRHVRRQRK